MIPLKIKAIILKHSENNDSTIKTINKSIEQIRTSLMEIHQEIANEISVIMNDFDQEDIPKDLLEDSISLKKYINSLNNGKIQISETATASNDNTKILVYVLQDSTCPFCETNLIEHYTKYYRYSKQQYEVKFHRCMECKRLYALYSEIGNFDNSNTNIELNYNFCKPISLSETIYVVANISSCSQNHSIKDVHCMIPVVNKNGKFSIETITIAFCTTCSKYYMMIPQYEDLLNKGIPCIEIVDQTKEKISNNSSSYNTKTQNEPGSKLTRLGYNVNCIDDLPDNQRHAILECALKYQNMSESEIISYLSSNISNGKTRKENNCKKDWSNAVSKWENDMEYIKNLKSKPYKFITAGKLVLQYFVNKNFS